MQPIRVKTVQESDLRMLGNLARNIQRVLPVTQADIDAAAALGEGWVVWKVFEVSDPLDNMRGGTQLIIRQNSIQPGQNVRRVIFVSGPGGQTVVIRGSNYIVLPDAIADSLSYVKAFGGTEHVAENYIDSVTVDGKCEQRNLPDNYIQRDYIYMMDGSYLLTDIVPTYDGHYEIDFQTTTLPAISEYFLGGRTIGYGGLFFARTTSGGFIVDAFGTGASHRYTSNVFPTNNTRYKFTYDNQVAKVESGGTTLFTNTFSTTNANGAALCINGLNSLGEITPGQSGIYLYSFKAWNAQGELVADYVPVIQKGTVPVVGFYDTVSGTFKTATAGTFAAGSETMPTPDKPMDIWCNNGVLKASKNLFDINDLNISSNPGDIVLYKSFAVPNGTYTMSTPDFPTGSITANIFFLAGNVSSGAASATNGVFQGISRTINVSDGYYTIGYRSGLTNPDNPKDYSWQIELGSTPTTYRPYGQIYTDGTAEVLTDDAGNTASVANVLSCGNFKDTQEILTGAVTRNVGIKVLDGTETFVFSTVGNVCVFPQSVFQNILEDGEVLCSHLTYTNTVPGVSDRENKIFWALSSGSEQLFLGFNNAELNSESKIRQYLTQQYANGTPVIIVYPLATATTESVAGQVLTKTPVTQTAGSLTTNITTVATDHTVPTPTQPLDINCNNGVLKVRHQSGLPLGYTLLEYLQSDKNQYIDTGVKTGSATSYGYDLTYQYTELLPGVGNGVTIVGIRQTNSEGGWGNLYWANYTGFTNGRSIYGGLPNSAIQYFEDATNTTTVYTTSFDANKTTRAWSITDNVSGSFSGTLDRPFDCSDLNVYLFRFNSGTQTPNQLPKVRVYSFRIRVDGNVVRNFIPAKRNSDNVIGMYDTVTGTFFGNAGTGTFTAGSTVSDPVEIYTDGTVETIAFNLIEETHENWGVNSSGVVVTTGSVWGHVAKVEPNKTYYYKQTGSNVVIGYFTSKPEVGSVTYNQARTVTNAGYFTTPNDNSIKYVLLRAGSSSYIYDKSATCEDLLSIGNYTDIQSIIDGVVTRKVGVKILDGTENWSLATYWGTHAFSLPRFDGGSGIVPLICSHNTNYAGSSAVALNNQCTMRGSSFILSNNDYTNTSATDFKQWLADQYNAGNPVIVVYPLATPTTESVTGQTLQVQAGDNTLEITQASMSGLELEAKYQAAVSLTIQEVQDANLDPNVEVTIN